MFLGFLKLKRPNISLSIFNCSICKIFMLVEFVVNWAMQCITEYLMMMMFITAFLFILFIKYFIQAMEIRDANIGRTEISYSDL